MFKIITLLFSALSNIDSLNLYSENTLDNIKFIEEHNNNHSNSYELGINQHIYNVYENEFTKSNMVIDINDKVNENNLDYIIDTPHEFDWRKEGKVTPVKNQGRCGSCWAFSSTESVESAWAIKNNQLYNLSEQELMDCSDSYGNHGCQGGAMDNAFHYIIDNGLCSNVSYPYEGVKDVCMNTTCNKLVHITNFTDVMQNNENILKKAVSINPVSVAIQANKRSFQLYQSGIYSDYMCGFNLDHGVLIVGYGYDELYEMDYWIVKNSWGPFWGENGYIRLERNINDPRGLCGIAMDPSFPIV